MTKKKPAETEPRTLGDDEIVRLGDGPRYFGVQATQLAELIKSRAIPAPLRLSERARGWRMATIREHHAKLAEQAAERERLPDRD